MTPEQDWIPVTALVTECRYQSLNLSPLAFGVGFGKKYSIRFEYLAGGSLHTDEFQSASAVPQHTTLAITYNPGQPQQNSQTNRSATAPPTRSLQIYLAVGGSVFVTLLWLASLRGCM